MTRIELPAEFLDRDVMVVWNDNSELKGRIVGYNAPHYILLKAGSRLHLVPWGAVSDIWISEEERVEARKK